MDIYGYYVYAYLREDGTPYYIGKGKDRRAYSKNHNVNPPTDTSRIVFLETNLSNIGALALERRYIRWYGRIDIGTGILRNMTDGGEGASRRRSTFTFKCQRCDYTAELSYNKRNNTKKYCSIRCGAHRVHSPESIAKRRDSLKQYYAMCPY